jgi:hypothetical protein
MKLNPLLHNRELNLNSKFYETPTVHDFKNNFGSPVQIYQKNIIKSWKKPENFAIHNFNYILIQNY